jgi:hypothetical protein
VCHLRLAVPHLAGHTEPVCVCVCVCCSVRVSESVCVIKSVYESVGV